MSLFRCFRQDSHGPYLLPVFICAVTYIAILADIDFDCCISFVPCSCILPVCSDNKT